MTKRLQPMSDEEWAGYLHNMQRTVGAIYERARALRDSGEPRLLGHARVVQRLAANRWQRLRELVEV